ncbi:hypothetical protein [Neoaquamicrobium sediminum]|uniref:hypothetical protein n=1 Tax=Neoaquamicrobium sediminum TaxID=1849104 RepID=UPI0040368571
MADPVVGTAAPAAASAARDEAKKSEEVVGRDEAEVVPETAPSVAAMVAMFEG